MNNFLRKRNERRINPPPSRNVVNGSGGQFNLRAGMGLKNQIATGAFGVCAAGLISAFAPSARAEFVFSIFSGVSIVEDNDLTLHQPGEDLTFHDVSYKTQDFKGPFYYGARLSYFLPKHSNWGFGLEFFHSKMYLQTDDSVRVTGQRGGANVDQTEKIEGTITAFSISHGLNILAADVIYRWQFGQRGHGVAGRFQPYVGGGIGVAIPHVESTIKTVSFEEYQLDGPAFLGFAGVNFDISKHWGVFAEYKISYVDLGSLDVPGGSYEVSPLIHHFVAGVSFKL
jgi:lipid A oxidase